MSPHRDPMEVFPTLAESLLSDQPHDLCYDEDRHRWELELPASSESGFPTKLVCESHGIYPEALEWHGAPFDFGTRPTEDVCRDAIQFLRLIASPQARIRIDESNGRPYRWTLELRESGQWTSYEETGLLFFNYFGKRTQRVVRQGDPGGASDS